NNIKNNNEMLNQLEKDLAEHPYEYVIQKHHNYIIGFLDVTWAEKEKEKYSLRLFISSLLWFGLLFLSIPSLLLALDVAKTAFGAGFFSDISEYILNVLPFSDVSPVIGTYFAA
ncbi:MAG: hypothetical protein AAF850_08485, partial [Pseudomonadota bacterium]